jgi:hypothetical protein
MMGSVRCPGLSPNIDSYKRRMVEVDGHRSHGDYRFSGWGGIKLGLMQPCRPGGKTCGKAGPRPISKDESPESRTWPSYPPDSAFPDEGLILRITDAKKGR